MENMNWDPILLAPMIIVLVVLFVDLFKTPRDW